MRFSNDNVAENAAAGACRSRYRCADAHLDEEMTQKHAGIDVGGLIGVGVARYTPRYSRIRIADQG